MVSDSNCGEIALLVQKSDSFSYSRIIIIYVPLSCKEEHFINSGLMCYLNEKCTCIADRLSTVYLVINFF